MRQPATSRVPQQNENLIYAAEKVHVKAQISAYMAIKGGWNVLDLDATHKPFSRQKLTRSSVCSFLKIRAGPALRRDLPGMVLRLR